MLGDISWTEKKRKQFKQSIRNKAISQQMRNFRKKFILLGSTHEIQISQLYSSQAKGISDSYSQKMQDGQIDAIMMKLQEGIIFEKQKLWDQEFLDFLKSLSNFLQAGIYEKMYVILMRMSSCQEEWIHHKLQQFLNLIMDGISSHSYLLFVLKNCSSCIIPNKKYLFYQVFQQKQIGKLLLNLDRKDIIQCLIEIYKNFFAKTPIIVHKLDEELQRKKIMQSFQVISVIGNKIMDLKVINFIQLSQVLNLFLALLLRNRKKEKRVILQTCFDAYTYKFFVTLLNICDKKWDIRIRYKVFQILKQILTEHPEINIQIFYSLAYVMDKFTFQQIQSFRVKPEETDPLFGKICQTYKEFLIIFLQLRFMHILVGANYLAQKKESQFCDLLFFILQENHLLQRSYRRKICFIIDFFLQRKCLETQQFSYFMEAIFTFGVEMLKDESFCPLTIEKLLSILILILNSYHSHEISRIVSQELNMLEKVIQKLYSETDNDRILKKASSLEKLLTTWQNNFDS